VAFCQLSLADNLRRRQHTNLFVQQSAKLFFRLEITKLTARRYIHSFIPSITTPTNLERKFQPTWIFSIRNEPGKGQKGKETKGIMSSPEESPIQQAARRRRERREAKLKADGSARLDKITGGRIPPGGAIPIVMLPSFESMLVTAPRMCADRS
jgi:hypothetical protein